MSLGEVGAMLNVVIVLVLLYLAVSLACSTILEWIAGRVERRARMLRQRIEQLLGSTEAQAFFDSALIRGLSGSSGAPSYIPAAEFATAALQPAMTATGIDREKLSKAIRALHDEVGGDSDKLRARVALWYDAGMERLSGTYHRWSQLWLLLIGLGVAALFNLYSVSLASHLWADRQTLEPIVARIEAWHAETGRAAPTTDEDWAALAADDGFRAIVRGAAPELTIPFGYQGKDIEAELTAAWHGLGVVRFLGWLVTAMAAMLGAKFWFDVLGSALNLRAAGAKPALPPSS